MFVIFKWISSWRFALLLIFITLCWVAAATFIESYASREQAENWVYGSLLFHLLLAGFFLNILTSALSRFPFKQKHLPFLITHLGLLMVIGGVFAKSVWGLQGEIYLIEGSATSLVKIPHEKALWIETKSPPSYQSIPLAELSKDSSLPRLIESHPHARQSYLGWMDLESVRVWGLPPIPLNASPYWVDQDQGSPIGFLGRRSTSWEKEVEEIFKQAFVLQIEDVAGKVLEEGSVKDFIEDKKSFKARLIGSALEITPPHSYSPPYRTKLEGNYFVLFHQAPPQKDVDLITLSSSGTVKVFHYSADTLEKWVAYDRGFKGYTLSAEWEWDRPITLETPLRRHFTTHRNHDEKQKPLVIVSYKDQKIPLSFDRSGHDIKWPAGDGNTLLKFQPHQVKLPYQVRLHKAQEVFYPGTNKPYSYEAEVTFTDLKTSDSTKAHLQMNHVHETKEGYRFYLAGMGKIDPHGVMAAQLVVNYDPFKYGLTYPGALLVVLGSIALFLWRVEKKSKNT